MRITKILVLLAAAALCASSASASGIEAELFIQGVFGGIDAHEVPCPTNVKELATSHDMTAVCAQYDGDFTTFEAKWEHHVAGGDDDNGFGTTDSTDRPKLEPRTDWKWSEGAHERIYAIDQTVVGVRFADGMIIAVYLESIGSARG